MQSVMTHADAAKFAGIELVMAELDREVTVPVVTEIAAQGDVLIFKADNKTRATHVPTKVVGKAGHPVVRGENGGNTHLLQPVAGTVHFDEIATSEVGDVRLGVLTVSDGGQALLSHPEHGGYLIDPGTYMVNRQREYAGEWALVAD